MDETITPLKFNRKLSFEEILTLVDKINEFNISAKVEMTIISLSALERRARAKTSNDAIALPIPDVSQQREQLLAFMQMREGHAVDTVDIRLIDEFLKVNNCG